MNYSAKIKETDSEFDNGDDAPVIIGGGYTIRGLEDALKEMKVGDKKTVEIPPEKAFGPRNPAFMKLIPISEEKELIEERAGRPGGVFVVNPKVDDIPAKFQVEGPDKRKYG